MRQFYKDPQALKSGMIPIWPFGRASRGSLEGRFVGQALHMGKAFTNFKPCSVNQTLSSTIQPQDATDCYMGTTERFKNELVFALNMDSIISHGFCATQDKIQDTRHNIPLISL
jgi:hypothetical protein